MNTAREHACAAWRTPSPSVDALEGAITAYAEEVTAGLQKELEQLRSQLKELINDADSVFNEGYAAGYSQGGDDQSAFDHGQGTKHQSVMDRDKRNAWLDSETKAQMSELERSL